jgi:hypothetical protein
MANTDTPKIIQVIIIIMQIQWVQLKIQYFGHREHGCFIWTSGVIQEK